MSIDLAGAVQACREEISSVHRRLDEIAARTASEHQRALDALRVVRDQDGRAWERLWSLRSQDEYEVAFEEDEPLVTIVVTTYDRTGLLRERALPSVMAQTYERFECIVVGDAAPNGTEKAVSSFGDPRVRFLNLAYRGPYPPDDADAWMVGGTTPFNTGMALAAGRWIGALNDDDALRPTYIERLLELARARRAEVAYGQLLKHDPRSRATLLGTFPPECGQWGPTFSLMHSGLRYLSLQPTDWLFGVPHDCSLLERMLRVGVRFAMVEEVVGDYYPSLLWTARSAPR
jgi:Glycosyl transferase family 2